MKIDLSLYVIIDEAFCHPTNMVEITKKLIMNGVTCIQLRMKNSSIKDIKKIAVQLLCLLKPGNIPLIINDHIEIAKEIDADGVHIGQNDILYLKAREYLGYQKIIGLSIENIHQARQAQYWDVDYFGVGPIYVTSSKPDAALPLGIQHLKQIIALLPKPIVAIGGISEKNIIPVLATGVAGIAIISAILTAPIPELAAKNFAEIISNSRVNYVQQNQSLLCTNYCGL